MNIEYLAILPGLAIAFILGYIIVGGIFVAFAKPCRRVVEYGDGTFRVEKGLTLLGFSHKKTPHYMFKPKKCITRKVFTTYKEAVDAAETDLKKSLQFEISQTKVYCGNWVSK